MHTFTWHSILTDHYLHFSVPWVIYLGSLVNNTFHRLSAVLADWKFLLVILPHLLDHRYLWQKIITLQVFICVRRRVCRRVLRLLLLRRRRPFSRRRVRVARPHRSVRTRNTSRPERAAALPHTSRPERAAALAPHISRLERAAALLPHTSRTERSAVPLVVSRSEGTAVDGDL